MRLNTGWPTPSSISKGFRTKLDILNDARASLGMERIAIDGVSDAKSRPSVRSVPVGLPVEDPLPVAHADTPKKP